jgi:2',3'-cyclic-nucleotide 2'-phosphodiesterase (5'-nucleotidase family)
MLKAVETLPIQIFNLTSSDLYHWAALSAASFPKTQIISTNLVPPKGSRSPLPRYAIYEVEIAGGEGRNVKLGFLGVANPAAVRPNSGFRAKKILDAIDEVKAEVMEQADVLIVIGEFRPGVAEELANRHPEVYAVLQLERQFRLIPPKQVNNAVILSSVERGRYLGQLNLQFGAQGDLVSYEPKSIQLDEKVPESAEFLELAEEVNKRIP